MRYLANNFLKGCLVLVPAAATVYAAYWLFRAIDGLISVGPPGVGVIVTVVSITLIGALASSVVGKAGFGLVERLLKSVPLLNLLYSSLRDFMAALVGEQRSFDRPVVVTVGGTGAKALGFVTHEDMTFYGLSDHVAVYFPQSLNFAGNLLLFPRGAVEPLAVDNARFMAFIVSAGVTGRREDSLPPPV